MNTIGDGEKVPCVIALWEASTSKEFINSRCLHDIERQAPLHRSDSMQVAPDMFAVTCPKETTLVIDCDDEATEKGSIVRIPAHHTQTVRIPPYCKGTTREGNPTILVGKRGTIEFNVDEFEGRNSTSIDVGLNGDVLNMFKNSPEGISLKQMIRNNQHLEELKLNQAYSQQQFFIVISVLFSLFIVMILGFFLLGRRVILAISGTL